MKHIWIISCPENYFTKHCVICLLAVGNANHAQKLLSLLLNCYINVTLYSVTALSAMTFGEALKHAGPDQLIQSVKRDP